MLAVALLTSASLSALLAQLARWCLIADEPQYIGTLLQPLTPEHSDWSLTALSDTFRSKSHRLYLNSENFKKCYVIKFKKGRYFKNMSNKYSPNIWKYFIVKECWKSKANVPYICSFKPEVRLQFIIKWGKIVFKSQSLEVSVLRETVANKQQGCN